jgi:gas vesicle protein
MFIATISNYEDLGLKSLLIATIVALSFVVRYLYTSKEAAITEKSKELTEAIKSKDERILEVIKSHQNDLKEANNDMKIFVEKYHQFTQSLKDLVDVRRERV